MVGTLLARDYLKIGYSYGTPPHRWISELSPAQFKNFLTNDLVIGHEYYPSFRAKLGGGSRYFAMMRDPVDRLISYYSHAMTSYPEYREHKLSPLKFLASGDAQIENYQLKYFTGGGVTPEDLKRAIDLVASGEIEVGIQEYFTESVQVLDIFRTKKVPTGAKENVSNFGFSRQSLTDEEISTFRKKVELEATLYEFCRDVLLRRWAATPHPRGYIHS